MSGHSTENLQDEQSRRPDRTIEWLTIVLCVLSLVVAGALGAKVRTGGTGASVTYGVIDDFGSIVVNGVHYDETAANIIIDGVPGAARSALRLGMVVEIEGERDYALDTGIANTIRVNRTLLGQVQRIDSGTGELVVLAQRVVTNAYTRFAGIAGVGQFVPGDWVSIHGLDDPGRKTLVATLVEGLAGGGMEASSIRGTVSNANKGRFRIGALDIVTAGALPVDGDYAAVSGIFDGRILLASEVGITREVDVVDGDETEIQGYVADFRGPGQFSVAGIMIDASLAEYYSGRASDLRPGARITVEGVVRNGILYADEVEFPAVGGGSVTEVEGRISSFTALDNFVVKSVRIDASLATIRNNTGRAPGAGLKAHVKGPVDEGGILRAFSVEFETP